jgi:hypothetical protein
VRRVSTVEGTFQSLQRLALRAFRTLEQEFDPELTALSAPLDELEPTLAYPIALDAVTPPLPLRPSGGPQPSLR